MTATLLATLLTLLAPPSFADEAGTPAPPAEMHADGAPASYGHGLQLGVRGALTGGYRMMFRYDESPFCKAPDPAKLDKDQQKVCGHGSPLATDLALSFGLLGSFEPYLWARLGLAKESETSTNAVKLVGAGARLYTMSDSWLKIFIEPAIGLELEGGSGKSAWQPRDPATTIDYKKDLIFHVAAGPQFDFAKYAGIYLNGGITAGVLRSLSASVELSAGLQLRAP